MDQERNQVREIEDARRRVADDLRSVAQNANVVERAKETAQNRMEEVRSTVGKRVRQLRDRLENAREAMEQSARDGMRNGMRNIPKMRENPVGLVITGVAAGCLIGMMLPVPRFGSKRMRQIEREMKDKSRPRDSHVVRGGGEVIIETISMGQV